MLYSIGVPPYPYWFILCYCLDVESKKKGFLISILLSSWSNLDFPFNIDFIMSFNKKTVITIRTIFDGNDERHISFSDEKISSHEDFWAVNTKSLNFLCALQRWSAQLLEIYQVSAANNACSTLLKSIIKIWSLGTFCYENCFRLTFEKKREEGMCKPKMVLVIVVRCMIARFFSLSKPSKGCTHWAVFSIPSSNLSLNTVH